ncbi:MAG: DUF805 domain-containing protein [Alphaproteobacteria bacterium]
MKRLWKLYRSEFAPVKGRLNRMQYLERILVVMFAALFMALLAYTCALLIKSKFLTPPMPTIAVVILIAFVLFLFWSYLSLLIRRCHDFGMSGAVTILIVFVASAVSLVDEEVQLGLPIEIPGLLLSAAPFLIPGHRGPNAYGDPSVGTLGKGNRRRELAVIGIAVVIAGITGIRIFNDAQSGADFPYCVSSRIEKVAGDIEIARLRPQFDPKFITSEHSRFMSYVLPGLDPKSDALIPSPNTYYLDASSHRPKDRRHLSGLFGSVKPQRIASASLCTKKMGREGNVCRSRTYRFFDDHKPEAIAELVRSDIVKAKPVMKVCTAAAG